LLAAITLSSQRGKGSHFCLSFKFNLNFTFALAKAREVVMMAGSQINKNGDNCLNG
jgi:hypothetical protein